MTTQAQALEVQDWSKLEPVHDPGLVILLDLNNTLVSGPRKTVNLPGKSYGDKIPHENYRLGLVELIKGHTVVLYTVRNEKHRAVTLENIANKCNGWQPHDAYFNETEGSTGATVKGAYLREFIFPKYGMPDQRKYYGIESDSGVRSMLWKRYQIPADPVGKYFTWTRLPYYDESAASR